MTNPTPSPAPQWANQASGVRYAVTVRLREAEECLSNYDTDPMMQDIAQRARNDRDSAKVVLAFIDDPLTKHAAAISEENAKLKAERDQWRMSSVCRELREENQRLRGEIDQLVMERDHYHDERDTLRQWSEQATAAMETVEHFLRCLNKAGVEEPSIANYYKRQAGRHLNEVLIPLLQSHPAATNLTEERK